MLKFLYRRKHVEATDRRYSRFRVAEATIILPAKQRWTTYDVPIDVITMPNIAVLTEYGSSEKAETRSRIGLK